MTVREDRASSFDEAVSTNRDALLAYFQRRLSNPADAAEAFGELLLTAWRARRRMPKGEAETRMWLYGIARNVLRNAKRTLARRSAAVQNLKEEFTAHAHEVEPLHEEVREAIATLPAEDAELLRLVYWDGLNSHEAAQIIGINASTARSRLSKARATIRTVLEHTNAPAGERHV